MKSIVLIAAALLSGCAMVPVGTIYNACRALDVAHREADLAPSWYERTGAVLESCGIPDARERTIEAVCSAQKRNGYGCDV